MNVIHIKDALRLLESGQPCNLGGTHRVRLPNSGLIRSFRDITLFEINNMTIYL